MRTGTNGLGSDDLARPLVTLHSLFEARSWPCHIQAHEEIVGEIQASWAKYQIRAIWRAEDNVLQLLCLPSLRVSPERIASAYELTGLINEQLWLGHFEIWSKGAVVLYRHAIMLGGGEMLDLEQAQDAVETAVEECDRFYPAFQFLLWGDKSASDALDSALVDAVGEA